MRLFGKSPHDQAVDNSNVVERPVVRITTATLTLPDGWPLPAFGNTARYMVEAVVTEVSLSTTYDGTTRECATLTPANIITSSWV